jgi:hypothetical protein
VNGKLPASGIDAARVSRVDHLASALDHMNSALDHLDNAQAPDDIGAHLDLAVQRLRAVIGKVRPDTELDRTADPF